MITPAFTQLMMIMPFITNAFIYVQAYKIWKRQSHDDVSFLTSVFSIISAIIWGVLWVEHQQYALDDERNHCCVRFYFNCLLEGADSIKNSKWMEMDLIDNTAVFRICSKK